ncbi:hypothetical protein F183_A50880 [Bryobacterales bacterium F-183]|nr:hypothetical protein F183_A50880 [Bryobacterales bacterium F-183]
MFSVGEKFGDYEVLQILGAGGMGQVYKVRNTLSDRSEAMKVLLPNLEKQADLLDRFMREIKVQAGLQHKNIAGLHTAQRQGDRILMFIEFVDGITLDKALSRGPLSADLAANIIGQVLEALEYAHGRGVVHRDIKPENIMVQPDGTVKLMDFGIARLAQDRRLTSTGRTVGSLYYMSPEQIRGADDLDGRSDLYSLGITLYQCVTGKRPFDGDSDYSIMSAHMMSNPVPPIQLDSRVPQPLNDVILRAIAKDREVRLQSAAEFRSVLLASVGAATGTAQATRATVPMVSASAAPAAPTMVMHPPPPPPPQPQPVASIPAPPPPPASLGGPHAGSNSKGLWIGLAGLVLMGGGWFALGMLGIIPLPAFWGGGKADPSVVEAKPVAVESTTTPAPVATVPQQPVTSTPAPVQTPATTSLPPKQQAQQQQQQPQPQRTTATNTPAPVSVTPASTSTAYPVPQAPQQPSYQQPPQQQQQPQYQAAPAVDQQAVRDLEEARQKFNSLAVRASSAKASVRSLQEQQRASGFGLRRDILEAVTRFDYLMKEASDSLVSRNGGAAKSTLETAERNLQLIEKFLGN